MNMVEMFRAIVASLVAVAVFVPLSGVAQRRPDLSGNWVLVTATTTGSRTTGKSETPKASGEVPTTSTTISGAAFNCGTECTIIQKGQTLTVDKALLASRPTPALAVTLHLDGHQMSVVDSFNPPREIPVMAKWNGTRLEITTSTGSHAYNQLISLERTQLVVVTSSNFGADQPVTFRYKKK